MCLRTFVLTIKRYFMALIKREPLEPLEIPKFLGTSVQKQGKITQICLIIIHSISQGCISSQILYNSKSHIPVTNRDKLKSLERLFQTQLHLINFSLQFPKSSTDLSYDGKQLGSGTQGKVQWIIYHTISKFSLMMI